MAERILSRRPRVMPVSPDLREPAGQDQYSPLAEEQLASLVYLAGVSSSNVAVAQYIKSLNNTAYARTLQGAT